MNDKTILLLDKLIQLTTDKLMTWDNYEESSALNPESKTIFSTPPIVSAFSPTLIPSRSYVAHYMSGYIGLFAYTNMGINVYVKLMVQVAENTLPQTVATSSNENTDIASKVKRLYNLIDMSSTEADITGYIDDIINS